MSRKICMACEIRTIHDNQLVCDDCHKRYQKDSWEDYPDLEDL